VKTTGHLFKTTQLIT